MLTGKVQMLQEILGDSVSSGANRTTLQPAELIIQLASLQDRLRERDV